MRPKTLYLRKEAYYYLIRTYPYLTKEEVIKAIGDPRKKIVSEIQPIKTLYKFYKDKEIMYRFQYIDKEKKTKKKRIFNKFKYQFPKDKLDQWAIEKEI